MDEKLRELTGKKGVEVIEKSFTWETISERLASFLSRGIK
jgi:glycosyltransferase involved in cell wall biosynthesis